MTNEDYDFAGAHTVKIYKVSTAAMNNYGRNSAGGNRYGIPADLEATTETQVMSQDRSFTFVIDTLDQDETQAALAAASALSRQVREVVIPEVDTYTYGVMAAGAGTKKTMTAALSASNIYEEILATSKVFDDNEVPEDQRALIVTPDTFRLMKKSNEIVMETEVGADDRKKGVIGNLDGMTVIKVAANKLPAKLHFMACHKSATVNPVKLESYQTHHNPPGISGDLVEGRIVYDAFVLENKAKAIYTCSAQ